MRIDIAITLKTSNALYTKRYSNQSVLLLVVVVVSGMQLKIA